MAPWSEFGREVGADDCFGEPPLDFAGRRSTEGDEGTFVQKILDLQDCELDERYDKFMSKLTLVLKKGFLRGISPLEGRVTMKGKLDRIHLPLLKI